MTARILAKLGPDIRWHLTVVFAWQIAICAFWFGGAR